MVYKTQQLKYSHQDIKAFWNKDLLIVKQVCVNAIAQVNQQNPQTPKEITEQASELLKWFYPNGTQYKCDNPKCPECNPTASHTHPENKEVIDFNKDEEGTFDEHLEEIKR